VVWKEVAMRHLKAYALAVLIGMALLLSPVIVTLLTAGVVAW